MAKHPNAVKLDDSFVPQWTHKTTLADEGYEALQASISAKEFIENGGLKNYYLQSADDSDAAIVRSMNVAGVLAKHLRLMGNPLIFARLSAALQEQRILGMDREIEHYNPVMTVKGKGYIVIPDFGSDVDPKTADIWKLPDLRDLGTYLIAHIHDGGGLVLAGAPSCSLTCFGKDFPSIIEKSFERHLIK